MSCSNRSSAFFRSPLLVFRAFPLYCRGRCRDRASHRRLGCRNQTSQGHTLWGGIIGEDGINGIALGPDYPGNALVDFQRRLLDYQQRGLILTLCNKNNPADVEQVLKEHPHQILRDEHFASRRVNWVPKPDNLRLASPNASAGRGCTDTIEASGCCHSRLKTLLRRSCMFRSGDAMNSRKV
jgi:hypothetical protein